MKLPPSLLPILFFTIPAQAADPEVYAKVTRRLEPSHRLASIQLDCRTQCTISRRIGGKLIKSVPMSSEAARVDVRNFFLALQGHKITSAKPRKRCDHRFEYEVRMGTALSKGCITMAEEHDAGFLELNSKVLEPVQLLESKLQTRLDPPR